MLTETRFIPAPAGNADSAAPPGGPGAVHPRACGERINSAISRMSSVGSSPRLRGTRRVPRLRAGRLRFIPAPAGNAGCRYRWCGNRPVHPRACGERCSTCRISASTRGSSPRLRGTHPLCQAPRAGCRFIPAPAGNAAQRTASSCVSSVHPRACGERIAAATAATAMIGSSPRLRGTRVCHGDRGAVRRFIPAPAGNAGSEP